MCFYYLAYITRVTVNRFVDAAISNAAECLSVWKLCIQIEKTQNHEQNAIMDVKKIVVKTKTDEIQVQDCWWLLIIAVYHIKWYLLNLLLATIY